MSQRRVWERRRRGTQPGTQRPLPLRSGKKYKQCHLAEDEAKARSERAKAADEAPAVAAEAAGPAPAAPKHQTRQPWKKTATNTHGFGKTSLPRKVGGS